MTTTPWSRFTARTFRSLSHSNYRRFALGALIANVGAWLQRIAQDWLILQITHQSGSAVGITTALQFLPMLLIGPYAGLLADRYSKRMILYGSGSVTGLSALTMGLLASSGHATVLWVYLLALLLGIGTAVDAPTRQVFVRDLVGADDLANAIGLNAASFHTARVIGPAVGGLLIGAYGVGVVFLVNAASTLIVFWTLSAIDLSQVRTNSRSGVRERGELRAATRYLADRPRLLVITVLAGLVSTFALNFQVTITLMSTVEFHQGATQFGLLSSMMAIGSVTGALLSARRSSPAAALVVGSAAALGGLYVLAGASPSYVVFGVLLVPIGMTSNTFLTSANTHVQLAVAPSMQGRVMALYIAISAGGTPFGAPLLGWIAEVLDPRWGLYTGGAVALVSTVAAALLLSRMPAPASVDPNPVARTTSTPGITRTDTRTAGAMVTTPPLQSPETS